MRLIGHSSHAFIENGVNQEKAIGMFASIAEEQLEAGGISSRYKKRRSHLSKAIKGQFRQLVKNAQSRHTSEGQGRSLGHGWRELYLALICTKLGL